MINSAEAAYARSKGGLETWPLATQPGTKSAIGPAYQKYDVIERLPGRTQEGRPLLPSCPSSYFMQLASTWDRGNRTVRERILADFVMHNRNKTGPQLEREFSNGASLFLTRLSAYLRLTYLLGHGLSKQLQAIHIFISASSGYRFLAEFLEVGGVLTVLEILGLAQVKEPDKAEALRVLISVAQAGRRYKEFICESYGVRAVADCLGRSRSEVTQDYARNLLHQLGVGNPKFLMQVYKSLLSLLTSQGPSPTSQQMAGQALRMLLPSIQAIHPSIVEATIMLLKNPHIQIQYEGYEILRELATRPALQDVIIVQLIAILKTSVEDTSAEDLPEDRRRRAKADAKPAAAANQWGGSFVKSDESKAQSEAISAGYMQQAYAAKLLGSLASTSHELAEKMIDAQIVSGLLSVIANVGHADSQQYAASTLIFLVGNFSFVANALREHMGQNFFELLEDKPNSFYKELNREQVRYLRRNNVQIHDSAEKKQAEDWDEAGSSDDDDAPGVVDPATGKLRAARGRSARSMANASRNPAAAAAGATATPFEMFPSTRDAAGTAAAGDPSLSSRGTSNNDDQLPATPFTAGAGGATLSDDVSGATAVAAKPTATLAGAASGLLSLDDPEDRPAPPPMQDLYVPFAQPVVNATFSARKFGKPDALGSSRETFAAELQKFRESEAAGGGGGSNAKWTDATRREEVSTAPKSSAWLNKLKNADFHDIKLVVDNSKPPERWEEGEGEGEGEGDGEGDGTTALGARDGTTESGVSIDSEAIAAWERSAGDGDGNGEESAGILSAESVPESSTVEPPEGSQ
ncbi:hypothetical protein HDU87_006413 [Geranomyces variabilis]|uniref:Uncharacterized protein n=1 Tax=Geranomyces variabilis TaxID=109894 RepID=A0AAD5XNF6_9FUNG|nr:hypothetical protein HDU87_006413 [Geranomyces variabilis]